MAISFVQVSIELFETLKVLASQPGYACQSDYLGRTCVAGPLGEADTVEEYCGGSCYSVSTMESSKCHWIRMKCDVFTKNVEMPELLSC